MNGPFLANFARNGPFIAFGTGAIFARSSELGRVGERRPPVMRLMGRASMRSVFGRGGAAMAWEIALVAVLGVVFAVRLALQLKRG